MVKWLSLLTFVAMLGCSSSPINLGGTTTTSGGSTTAGTSTGGTTTGGTTGGGLISGADCSANAQCLSGVCGINGTGKCCTASCSSSDATCGATACDVTGACTYPEPNVACGTSSCSSGMLTPETCNGAGQCAAGTPAPCPNNFVCNAAGTACLSMCTVLSDCASGFYCNAGGCAARIATGPCGTNDACTSGVCGISGHGNCCASATPCSTADPVCGASDCDADGGACVYPSAQTACTLAESCTTGVQSGPAGLCSGTGDCAAATVPCTPFLCGSSACLTSCTNATSCVTGAFCDIAIDAGSACCELANNGAIAIDSVQGTDTACCGVGTHKPCQTLTRAMAIVSGAKITNVTLNATVDGGGGDWSFAETYPVFLGWGVELNAPGVFFLDSDAGSPMLFDVQAATGDPLGYASVVGKATSPIGVGINSAQTIATIDSATIVIEASATLYIANALVDDMDNGSGTSSTIQVSPGGTLWLGQDQAATNTGTVYIGNDLGQPQTNGYVGINCLNDGVSLGGTVSDDANLPAGTSGVVVQGQSVALWLTDYSTATLTASPVFGQADCLTGTFTEVAGGIVDGHSSLTFSNGVVQCMGFAGLGTSSNTPGTPTLTIDKSTIEEAFQGVVSTAGKITVTNSTLTGNFAGAVQNAGTLDLSGGGNTVICSSNRLWGGFSVYGPGIDVYNTSTTNLAADNVTWDTPGPDYYSCDSVFQMCTCNNASCSVTPGADGMDAVEDSTALGGITTTNNSYIDAGCN